MSKVESVNGSPLSSTLLTSSIHDLLEHWGSILVVVVHDVARNLHEERVQDTLVPLSESITNLLGAHTESTLHDVVGLYDSVRVLSCIRILSDVLAYLSDELHVTVLNTVVHHLDVVTSTIVTDPLTAGLTVRLGRDGLEDVLDVWPGLLVTTGHDRGTVTSTLLTTGDTGTDESDTLVGEVLCAAVGVGVVRVTTIDDDITLFGTVVEELLDELVNRLSGHDEHHHAAGLLELGDEVLDVLGSDNGLALCLVLEEVVDLGDGTVVSNDSEAVVGGIEDQVLTHDGQTDKTEVTTVLHWIVVSLLLSIMRMIFWRGNSNGAAASFRSSP